jgi:hypothetical protein
MNIIYKKILGLFIGLLLSYIVHIACRTRNCIIYNIPNPDVIQENVYKSHNKCYKLKTDEVGCSL